MKAQKSAYAGDWISTLEVLNFLPKAGIIPLFYDFGPGYSSLSALRQSRSTH
ncbi:hypothetical protein [Leptospira yasudae]|uniref:hypothetical protein n=1 Tax=Leptospira yasudae TaxID=2202201 RepID=UPI001314DC50|nr:hypothetical protein [Leptospira yasudae]